MSGCRIKRNLNAGTSGCDSGKKEECSKEVGDKFAQMLAERKRQDEALNVVLSEKEYAEKYGSQPEANIKK
jgi:hypothetical protein